MHLKNRKKLFKFLTIVVMLLFIFIVIFFKIDKDIRPMMFALTSSELKIEATESINRVVKEELSQNIKYSDLISIKTDNNGNIAAIETNTVEMNKLGSEVALRVQDEMKFIGGRGIGIPLGVLTGSNLLAHVGPNIYVNVMPIGNVTTDFKSELESAGINQSRYRVYINVNTKLQIMVPLGSDDFNVSSTIPIAETLIVGKVPTTYFNTEPGGTSVPYVLPVPNNGTN